ncbi:dTDP-glucose 4,6-dehydratase [Lysinibacillus fusiformis]|uniref:dTDP-glucose 4,6-dehydratase n=1 Tax=Lysinibacillus fusiformis TaxID=28031 RepID=A0A1H9M1G2_9BACI|nr:dTDP-glucose 4,6-dehydratase [Lysinibacillus fusiformis]SCY58463.1 dTDP-glucose 4,6-dehydratase [Lysinibacillus fusiformis]SEO15690.1 dTDP-glucose 4,6-dehydratase [Lysinibacillus fusiformis]SER17484.1 dTDP-glucose 4,6-dehydratase [Lysinibacillus fusiformis]
MKLLVTGGAGFIGSNFIEFMLEKYKEVFIVNLDKLTYAGDVNNLLSIKGNENYKFVIGDICNRDLVESLFNEYRFDGVIHFAAESHVDNSIEKPDTFIQTNINGTFTLLDVARKTWMDAPFIYKKTYSHCRFLHISTDEVYGTLGDEGYFSEKTPYSPNSPYSASKAASDMLVRSYYHTYGMNVVTTNCSNNYGPKQHIEKLIPKIINNAVSLKKIPIYGAGQNIRDWLFVRDHCEAIDKVFRNGESGETYLIGGNNEKTNLEVVNTICEILDQKFKDKLKNSTYSSFKELITFVEDRAGHDYRYAIDYKKIRDTLDWYPKTSFYNGLKQTILYYV